MHDHQAAVALAVSGVQKTFGGVRALKGASLTIRAGEVHGLVGENGSGKSTLIKLLAGFHAPDVPTPIEICGRQVELPLGPGEARSLGVAFVHQELGLINDLTVMENLLIEDFATNAVWAISWRQQRAQALKVLSEFDVDIDPDQLVGDLRPTDRALLAVTRAVARIRAGLSSAENPRAPGLLVLDEPTVYLPVHDRQRLFDLMRSVSRTGVAILLVAHDIDEVLSITDRITVLRDGMVSGTAESRTTSASQLIGMILGVGTLVQTSHVRSPPASAPPTVRVSGLSGKAVRSFAFKARRGDIIGLTGLAGSGFDDIPYLLFGAEKSLSGTLDLDGVEHYLPSITPGCGVQLKIALIPADRLLAGAVGSLSVVDNVSLQVLKKYLRAAGLSRAQMVVDAAAIANKYDVRPRDPLLDFADLSGGNQQKVLLAKWLRSEPSLLLLHEPTQGVDVGAREEIFVLLRQAADAGCVVVVASTDHEQLAALCNRVLITRSGLIAYQLDGPSITKERITEMSYGKNEETGKPA
jgi:ribose transport system ATP-binding protein